MDYYFYNTDASTFYNPPLPRFRILIDKSFAAVGGDLHRFGERFRKLTQDDILLMYENKVGVVAVGRVLENWDGRQNTEPWYYHPTEMENLTGGAFEYRIGVDWFLNLSDNPVTLNQIRLRFYSPGFTPRGTVTKIDKYRDEIEEMIGEVLLSHLTTPDAVDLESAGTDRVETIIYRILRDTAIALQVKFLHEYKCQFCGHTIELTNGRRYAEAHHVMPLGKPHNGPDIFENIICVCPNHHAELDYGVSTIEISSLRCYKGHSVGSKFIDYHNQFVYKSKAK